MRSLLSWTIASVLAFTAAGVQAAFGQVSPDLVSRTALRVCSDPANMPFSDRRKQGFENKIADIVGGELKEPVRYLWAPSGPGFARNTLNADLCDIVMGYTNGSEVLQSTNPYYRSTYVMVVPHGSDLVGVESLDDPKLKGHAIGVVAATPPVDVMLAKGLMDKAQVYPLLVDHRFDSPLATMIADLQSKKIEAAVVWGPLVGLDVKNSKDTLVMTPLLKDVDKPGFSYRIGFGIRHDEPDWKHKLEAVIRKRRPDIDRVLVDYNVPRLDESGKIIAAKPAASDASHAVAPRAGNDGSPNPTSASLPAQQRANSPAKTDAPSPADTGQSAAPH